MAAYQAERWIDEALESILGQSRPPDEVVVVDDGSTDDTAARLRRFADRVTVVHQENAGYPAAMNRAIQVSSGEYVALCGADDIWEPQKLEWQGEALAAHPQIGVLFGHAVFFGAHEGDFPRPRCRGLLDGHQLWQDLFRVDVINMPSALIDRTVFERVGWFRPGFLADDYEFFFNCLRAGVQFYYEPRLTVRYRQHPRQITRSDRHGWSEAMVLVRTRNADGVDDPGLISEMLAPDLFKIGRRLADEGRTAEARRALRRALRHASGNSRSANARALITLFTLVLPEQLGRRVREALASASQALTLRARRDPAAFADGWD